MNNLDAETRIALVEKAESFRTQFDPDYWRNKTPTEPCNFIFACEVIKSMAGLIINMMEDKSCE